MIAYAIIMFTTALVFVILAVLIHKGKTELIHDYHQAKVTDKIGYGKAFGKTMGVFAGSMALSGVISLLGESVMWASVAVLLIGLAAGFVCMLFVQKKFNSGIF